MSFGHICGQGVDPGTSNDDGVDMTRTPSKEYLADLIWLRHDRRPADVWMQGLLVVAQFSDGTTAVHRLEVLEAGS